ncbi:hypothetical protein CAPTEDRAFT_218699 [Capitella teleta]|uniref:Uncharacterized protein n=1 Tax=Capitella teleta TaxID=283909 RepID=R7VI15_CAPTE|nr:hypothetical protein CAPTEDRAFT_218699 [Capitella teleta]|eukprot:ELU18172.1 hypothetical protein CAPTEDRAFT_218699 [Capitella teleta]
MAQCKDSVASPRLDTQRFCVITLLQRPPTATKLMFGDGGVDHLLDYMVGDPRHKSKMCLDLNVRSRRKMFKSRRMVFKSRRKMFKSRLSSCPIIALFSRRGSKFQVATLMSQSVAL